MRPILVLIASALVSAGAIAQQPAPPAPAFAASNLSPKGGQGMAGNCAACHGTAGRAAPGSAVPALAGRPAAELTQLMAQFKSGQRPATVMHQIAKGYSDAEIAAMAAYFSRLAR
ncbi:MAG: c-type cytochrome [Usitatibacter sp.]